jgi:hypothetical protein
MINFSIHTFEVTSQEKNEYPRGRERPEAPSEALCFIEASGVTEKAIPFRRT